jgi:hypothetical protein
MHGIAVRLVGGLPGGLMQWAFPIAHAVRSRRDHGGGMVKHADGHGANRHHRQGKQPQQRYQ